MVLRYSLVSLVSVGVFQSVLLVAFGLLHWTAQLANMVACTVATVWAADAGSMLASHMTASHAATTAIVMTAALLAFGVLWVGKFAIFSTMLFGERRSGSTAR